VAQRTQMSLLGAGVTLDFLRNTQPQFQEKTVLNFVTK